MYDSWKDWTTHERWAHNKAWRCAQHPHELYISVATFRQHVCTDHGHTLQEPEFSQLLHISETTVSDSATRACPLCYCNTQDSQQLQNHIATHLQRVALFALPRSHDVQNASEAGSSSSRANALGQESQDLETESESEDGRHAIESDNELILAHPDVDQSSKDNRERMLLSLAAMERHEEIAQLLLHLSSRDNREKKPLSLAATQRHKDIVLLLLHLRFKDKRKRFTSSLLVKEGYEEVARLLWRLDSKDSRKKTSLSPTAEGYKEFVQLLLDLGSADDDGEIWLSLAAMEGIKEVMQLLLDLGSKDNHEKVMLSVAAKEGYKEVLQLLLDLGSKESYEKTTFSLAVNGVHKEVMQPSDRVHDTNTESTIRLTFEAIESLPALEGIADRLRRMEQEPSTQSETMHLPLSENATSQILQQTIPQEDRVDDTSASADELNQDTLREITDPRTEDIENGNEVAAEDVFDLLESCIRCVDRLLQFCAMIAN